MLKTALFCVISPPFFKINRKICTLHVCLVIVGRKYYRPIPVAGYAWLTCAASEILITDLLVTVYGHPINWCYLKTARILSDFYLSEM